MVERATWVKAAAVLALAAGAASAEPTSGPTTRPTTEPATAVDAARQYTDQVKAGGAAEAFGTAWDLDAVFETAFGPAMAGVSAADRADMREQQLAVMRSALDRPGVAGLMRNSDYRHFAAGPAGADGRTPVTFELALPNGKVLSNGLTFRRDGAGQWRIVDATTGGRDLSTTLGAGYAGYAKNVPSATPPLFLRLVTRALRANQQQKP